MKKLLLFVCLILFLAKGADAQEVYKSKDEKSLPDSGEYIKVNKVISISPGDIRSNEAQNQLIQKEPYDSIIEARRQKVKKFVYKTLSEYAKVGLKTDSAGEELWKALAPYFSRLSVVQVDYRLSGVGLDYPSGYFFGSVLPEKLRNGHFKKIILTKKYMYFNFKKGSEKVKRLHLDLWPNQLSQPKDDRDSFLQREQKIAEKYVSKTLFEYSNEGFETDSTGEELWKKLTPYFGKESRVVTFDCQGSGNYPAEVFSKSVFPEKCIKASFVAVDIIQEEEIYFTFKTESHRIKLLELDLCRWAREVNY